MAGEFLYSAWKVFHAKFVKPVDNALDSFSMLMLQWMLGTYNIWDVLRITCGVATSAVSYVVSVILHPSILWTELQLNGEPDEETNARNEPGSTDAQDCVDEQVSNSDEQFSEASKQANQPQVSPTGDNNSRQRARSTEGAAE